MADIVRESWKRRWLRSLQRNRLWAGLVRQIWTPLYETFWKAVLNRKGKSLYASGVLPLRPDPEFSRSGVRVVREDPFFQDFARRLRADIPRKAVEEETRKITASDRPMAHRGELEPYLTDEARLRILRFALHPRVLAPIANYLGVVPRLKGYNMVLCVPHPRQDRRDGNKQWHRDAAGGDYKIVNLFICISEVDDDSGPLYVAPAPHIPYQAVIGFDEVDMRRPVWDRYRNTDKEIHRHVDPSSIEKISGAPGNAAYANVVRVYHRGGYCRTKKRLLLQLLYGTDAYYRTDGARPWNSSFAPDHPEVAALLENPLNRFVLGVEGTPQFPSPKMLFWTYYLSSNVMCYTA